MGRKVPFYKNIKNQWKDRNTLSDHILRGANYLDSIYNIFTNESDILEKEKIKSYSINKILVTIDTLGLSNKQRYMDHYRKNKPNNTFFMSFLRYRGDITILERELVTKIFQ